jgi:hypothetical protein
MFCQGTSCHPISDAIRSGLALWLDSSNLGPVGSRVSTWCDQSGKANHAIADNTDALPQVILQGVTFAYGMRNAAFYVPDSPAIDLGADDFLVLVVGGISRDQEAKSLFRKYELVGGAPKQVALEWLFQGESIGYRLVGLLNETSLVSGIATPTNLVVPERLYALRRSGDQVELRINGQIVSKVPSLGTPGASTRNEGDLYIGEWGNYNNVPIETLSAVVVVRGTTSDHDVGELEADLIEAFAL